MPRLPLRLLGAVALQFIILLSVLGFKQYTVATGETVRLAVLPLDPRSPFQGDYVILRYAISELDPATLGGDDYFGDNTVYVELAPEAGGAWRAVAVFNERRDVPDGHVLIKGELRERRFDRPAAPVRVTYGIEEVFVPEGSGRAVETAVAESLSVEVKVDRFGNAVPRRIFLDGEPLRLKRR